MRCVRVGYIYIAASLLGMFLTETFRCCSRSPETGRGEQFRHIGAQEGSIRFTATYSWKGDKRKDTCCSPNSGSANNVLCWTRATTARAG